MLTRSHNATPAGQQPQFHNKKHQRPMFDTFRPLSAHSGPPQYMSDVTAGLLHHPCQLFDSAVNQ
jgi:hypothetical protein